MARVNKFKFIKRWLKRATVALGCCGIALLLGDRMFPLDLSRYHDRSVVVYADQNKLAHVFLSRDEKYRIPIRFNEIPKLYVDTLLEREDRYFFEHWGINPVSIFRASISNLRSKRVVSGGSTLTMQTARLLEPRPRTVYSKLIECLRAFQLEWHYSKEEILAIYTTLAPFGSNIEGLKAASWAYYRKPVQQLTVADVALLVAVVQSPNRNRPDVSPGKALKARDRVLSLMQQARIISLQEYNVQRWAPLPKKMHAFPHEMPHLAWRLKSQYPTTDEFKTTIKLGLQQQIERIIAQYYLLLPERANAALLILDHITNQPVAYVASTNFYNANNHGFVDYIRAYRSPGSTLKPIIYGIAFDEGLLQPHSFLKDVRKRFGAYYPRNFDKTDHGTVSAREALALSLNIPAVSILNDVGVIRFLSILKEAGIAPLFPAGEQPGLSSALGGLGMNLEQLVTLYGGLAHQGKVAPLSYLSDNPSSESSQLISAKTAVILSDILAVEDTHGRIISIKTGTSYGHRDALAIGYDHQYVIGVWIGMPNGTPIRAATGATTAVPLLQKVHAILPHQKVVSIQGHQPEAIRLKESMALSTPLTVTLTDPLTMVFPVENTTISLDANDQVIPCSIQGGVRPYTWIINNEAQTPSWQTKYRWQPIASGFYTITVVDAQGQRVQSNVEVNCDSDRRFIS